MKTLPERFACLLGVLVVSGQVSLASLADPSAAQGMLWEVKSDQATMYVVGAVHLMDQASYPLPASIQNAIDRADQFVLEITQDDAISADSQNLLVASVLYLDGTSLSAQLSTAVSQKMANYVAENGSGFVGLPVSYEMCRPWYLAAQITLAEAKKDGLESALAMETAVEKLALESHKPIYPLETFAFQMGILAGNTQARQEEALALLLDHPEDIATSVRRLLDAWKRGDVELARRVLHEAQLSDPDYFEKSITARNRDWLPKLEAYLRQSKTTCVVGGLAHMVGGQGLPNLLRGRGYRVRRIPESGEDRIVQIHRPSHTEVSLALQVKIGWDYSLQVSPDLRQWTTLTNFFSTVESLTFQHRPPETMGAQFYRLRSP
jgi:uncharacterized protein YbaP (TraB family)